MSDSQKEHIIGQIKGIHRIDAEQVNAAVAIASHAYAIIEQSMYPDFLAQLYGLDSEALTWDYLFRSEQDDALRQAGPVLIMLNDNEVSQWLVDLLTQQVGGCFVNASSDFAETLLWAQARMTLFSPNDEQAICRFYDPRNLAFMLASQSPSQQQTFWHQTQSLYWHDAGQWWLDELTPMPQPLIKRYQLSQAELEGITSLKENTVKAQLKQHYQRVKPHKDKMSLTELIDEVFPVAKQYGATTVGEYDAWLRLMLRYGRERLSHQSLKNILQSPRYPLKKKIGLVERELRHDV
ncbi:DUF4123 domain-containing protein [Motilimonas pumila]|uniref:DUF4123 domain-containing protein n=1 Tax=Motilimonas pumila TaxID=2303987 RepID=A0A418Y9D7_9GAMM|nr:DUF4123 domain-containing protein [Motilimonas pumila]RJG37157.1 DUF4123 domain-containing protein [Motilimonas pumila]